MALIFYVCSKRECTMEREYDNDKQDKRAEPEATQAVNNQQKEEAPDHHRANEYFHINDARDEYG